MKFFRHTVAPALLACCAMPAFAQVDAPPALDAASPAHEQTPPVPEQAVDPPPSVQEADPALEQSAPAPSASITIPALTRVFVELQAEVGSNTSKSGDRFPFRLAVPLMVDGREAIPAGASGMGEVIHAKKNGAAGAPGELLLAARYLDVDGRRLKLRSLRLVPMGTNLTQAAGGASIGMGVFAFLIKGGQAIVPPGTIAEAKTAEAFTLTAVTGTPPQPADPPPQTELPPEQPADVPQPTENGEATQ